MFFASRNIRKNKPVMAALASAAIAVAVILAPNDASAWRFTNPLGNSTAWAQETPQQGQEESRLVPMEQTAPNQPEQNQPEQSEQVPLPEDIQPENAEPVGAEHKQVSSGKKAEIPHAGGKELTARIDKDERVELNFSNVDIRLVIKFFSELTGKNFIVDDKVKGNVTVISPKKVDREDAYRVFESILEVYGFAAVPSGNIVKIMPTASARQKGTELYISGENGSSEKASDKIVTQLIPLKYSNADRIASTLRPLIPSTSFITSFGEANTVIVADSVANIRKIQSIIDRLDTPGADQNITVIPLQYASAKKVAEMIGQIFGITQQAGPAQAGKPPAQMAGHDFSHRATVIPEERINALIVVATDGQTSIIRGLVRQLDVESPIGRGRVNVYYLKYANAEELSKVLGNMAGQAPKAPGQPGMPMPVPQHPGGGMSIMLKSDVSIVPDKATNSLVITASPEDYDALREVIEKLDVRRPQVFVEALIMEITSDAAAQFGVEWRLTNDFTQNQVGAIGGTSFGPSDTNINAIAQNPLAAPSGLVVGVVDGVMSYGGKTFLNLGGLVKAIRQDTGINILSTPNLLTTDNEEAEIVVADNVPFQTGETVTTGGNTVIAINRQNVGLTLRLTPQISASDYVRLVIYQEISGISPNQLSKAKDLITTNRTLKTTVIVRDQQNIVIGGLIKDDKTDDISKVPLLGDIPLLGWLFKYKSVKHRKTNLVVFLTPHIIRESGDIEHITGDRKEKFELHTDGDIPDKYSVQPTHRSQIPRLQERLAPVEPQSDAKPAEGGTAPAPVEPEITGTVTTEVVTVDTPALPAEPAQSETGAESATKPITGPDRE